MPDGLVLKVEKIEGGVATLRAGNAPLPEISTAEKEAIAKRFSVGDTFWRIPTNHFSPFDMNWGSLFPPGTNPSPLGGEGHAPMCAMGQKPGSIIGCPTQTLGERVPLNGTPFVLSYRTSRVEGYKAVLDIPVKPLERTERTIISAKVRAKISGQTYERLFSKTADVPTATSFVWDGKDQFGRKVQGAVNAEVEVFLAYEAPYLGVVSSSGGLDDEEDIFPPSFDSTSFSPTEGITIQLERGRVFIRRRYTQRLTAGTFDVVSEGLGGWTLNVHHRYDPIGRAVYYGYGSDQFARSDRKIEIVAGVESTESSNGFMSPPDGALAREQKYWGGTRPFAVDRSSAVLVIDNQRIRSIDPVTNIVSTLVGKDFDFSSISCSMGGECDTWDSDQGDGKPLEDIRFVTIKDLKVGRDGRVYILSNDHLWRLETNGTGTIILNAPESGLSEFPDGTAAKKVSVNVEAFDIADDGTVFFVDGKNKIYKISTDNRVRFVAGMFREHCEKTPCAEGDLAIKAYFNNIRDIAVSDLGELYIVEDVFGEPDQTLIRKIGNDGRMQTYAGPLAADSIDIGPSGGIFVSMQNTPQTAGAAIVQVLPRGELKARLGILGESEIGNGIGGFLGKPAIDNETALRFFPVGMAFDIAPNGTPYYGLPFQIFKSVELLPGFTGAEYEIPSSSGNQVYVFSKEGRHLNTHDANTGIIIWKFDYDQAGRLIGVEDRDGDKTTITHDAQGNPLSIVGPNGVTWSFQAKEKMLHQIISPENETYEFEYQNEGLMVSMTSPRGEASTFEYNLAGRLIKDNQPNGGSSTLERDVGLGEVTFTSASGLKTVYYSTAPAVRNRRAGSKTGDLSVVTIDDNKGWSETRSQDGTVNRTLLKAHPLYGPIANYPEISKITLPSGLEGMTTTELRATLLQDDLRSGLENWTIESTRSNRVSKAEWNHATSTLTTDTGLGRTGEVMLNSDGRPVQISSPGIADTKLEYDIQGRPSKIIRDTREISFQYNAQGYTESVTAADGTVKYSRDKMGRVLTLERKDATTAGFTYDPWGYLTSIIPPGAEPYTMEYDNRGNMIFMNSPNATRTQYEYDLDHRPIKMIKSDGREMTLFYDTSNRVKKVVSDGEDYDYTYFMTGQVEKIMGGQANLAYTWDGPLLKTQTYSGAVSGNLSIDYNDGTLDLKSMDINGTKIDIEYDIDGAPTKIGDLNLSYVSKTIRLKERSVLGMKTTFSYNTFGEPTTIETSDGLLKEEFTYDGLGRIEQLTRTDPNGSRVYNYMYDLLGQIREIKIDGNVSESYTYDENGNRTSAIGIAASRIRYDEDERMERYDSNTYTYNDAGQLKTKTRSGNTTTYNYSVTGRLKSVDLESGKTISYQHDALDRRITRQSGNTITQRFLYGSGLGPIAEVDDAGNTISTFVYGTRINVPDYMIRNGKTYYFVLDYLGSVRAVVDVASGNIEQEIDYDTFGQVLSDSNPGYQPFGFAGGLYDHETKLVRFGARDYDALTGRWTAPDPIGFNGGQFNLYVYVNADPANLTDPLGLYFFGENLAKRYICENGSARAAWGQIQYERKYGENKDTTIVVGSDSEARRNAEHYLYARKEVERNAFLWGPMGINAIGYAVVKFWSNTNRYWTGIGFPGVIEFWTGIRIEKVHKSVNTHDELVAGFEGADDGMFGTNKDCRCRK